LNRALQGRLIRDGVIAELTVQGRLRSDGVIAELTVDKSSDAGYSVDSSDVRAGS
jgi:hypothetical protein